MITTSEKEAIQSVKYKLFIIQYYEQFNHFLNNIDDSTKHLIKKNKQLDTMYDLFLDFVLDSGQIVETDKKA